MQVIDDGIGIEEDKINSILANEVTSSNGSGYGLNNINQRLKLSYGENYGLSFKSIYGCGTIVEIKIPSMKQNT